MVTVKSLLSIASGMEFRLNAMPLCLKRKMSQLCEKLAFFSDGYNTQPKNRIQQFMTIYLNVWLTAKM